MPAAGAADCLSLFLANRLVGNEPNEVALEITLTGASFISETTTVIALTGAACEFSINESLQAHHQSIMVEKGDQVSIGPAKAGSRSYLAVSGKFDANLILGSQSTYQPASLGGFHGRALREGDSLPLSSPEHTSFTDEITPHHFIPSIFDSIILRVTPGPEFSWLDSGSKIGLFEESWNASQRMNRMGTMLDGKTLQTKSMVSMQSAAAFPGTIQCPPDGLPFLLGPDAQTTGGYPRIAHVIKADRHLIGQLKPGSRIQLVNTTPEHATAIYREKLKLLQPWLGQVQLW